MLRKFLPQKLDAMHWALLVSLGLHAVLLSVRFVDPERFDRVFQDTPLEVVLVNARSKERPEQAQAIAQLNLAGGGQAERGRATSPLPPSAFTDLGDDTEEARRQIQAMQEQQSQLLAQIKRELAALPPPTPQGERSPQQQAEEERRRQLMKLLAEIEKRINEENARPRRKWVAPNTREEVYAVYYEQLRRRIETRGTQSFPEHQGQKLYGELTMVLTIDARGRLVATEVVQPSASPQLDRRAEAIVRAAAPFGNFTPPMRANADQIVVVSRFRFTREDGMETRLLNPQ
ncbi:energy transducer TonB [Caldimonas tepidiphila]|uniref:energy transducer TonB n=1 Tax=Caldimonas tepidiphila TaxID=2315841 RepID=UPI000E5B4B91|nr:energy transducer TonB [Caldimonas tepidiphila]